MEFKFKAPGVSYLYTNYNNVNFGNIDIMYKVLIIKIISSGQIYLRALFKSLIHSLMLYEL